MSNQEAELVIAGSGPAGYTAAVYAARAGLVKIVKLDADANPSSRPRSRS